MQIYKINKIPCSSHEPVYNLFFFLIYRTVKIITPENARACCGYLTPYTRGVRAILVETLNASCLPM
jgi:hypothetical protein